jgi:hypothetical protein
MECKGRLQLPPEGERHGATQEQKRNRIIPFDAFSQIHPRKYDEHAERDHFLDYFQLKPGEFPVADAVGGNLKAVFGEGNQPADYDCGNQRRPAVFQMAVPGDSHEDIRANQEKDSFHGAENGITRRSLAASSVFFMHKNVHKPERMI